jgi:predicted transcriptional regulator
MKKPTKASTKPVKEARGMFGIRLSADERAALDAAAAAEDRPAAYVARRAIMEWLERNGFLK